MNIICVSCRGLVCHFSADSACDGLPMLAQAKPQDLQRVFHICCNRHEKNLAHEGYVFYPIWTSVNLRDLIFEKGE